MKVLASTERLLLRELTPADAAFILRLVNTEGWLQHIGDRGVRSLADAENYIADGPAKSYRANGFGLWCIEEKSSGTAIGMCGLIRREGLEDVDIGFAVLPAYEGKGYVSEAAVATLQLAEKRFGIGRIVAITALNNERSIGLLHRLGFILEKTFFLPNDPEELNLFGKQLQPPEIRRQETLSPDEHEQVRRIWNSEYPASLYLETAEDFDAYLEKLGDRVHYLVLENEQMRGWAMTFRRDDARWFAMILDARIQRSGIGSRLLQRLKSDNERLFAWAIDRDTAVKRDGSLYASPLAFYVKNGFVKEEVRLEIPTMSGVRIRWELANWGARELGLGISS
jgi:[ribosomal protein S5]-alanine N-acetyltransferase